MGREVRAQEQYNDRNLQLESTVCPSYKHERSNSISRRILERVPQTQMFPPRKKKKNPPQDANPTNIPKKQQKKSKSNRQDIPGADTATASKDGRRRDKANYNRREEIKGYSPKSYHSRTHVTDKESLKGKEQT